MTRLFAALLLLCATSVAQSVPAANNEAPQRKSIFRNNRVEVSTANLAPGETSAMHKHSRDFLTVFLSGDRLQETFSGEKPNTDKVEVGEVLFKHAGYTHATTNVGSVPFKAVLVSFADPQGALKNVHKKSKTCTPDSKSCVEEKELFCTDKVCVEDVEMAPGSASVRHSHATDHMLIAVSDYELSDEVESKGTVVRSRKSGEVEYIPAGITHRLTNTGKEPARFIVILWN